MTEEEIPGELAITDETELGEIDVANFIQKLAETEGVFEAPIDINVSDAQPIMAPPLEWYNFEIPPKKMKVTNTGHTVILSAKWGQERPYITKGVLMGKYVFSQLHFHWGINDMEGSEHTIDGCMYPGEMHVVFFKSCYLTQESALKEKDGVVVLCYIFRLQEGPNLAFQMISEATHSITKAHTSLKLPPVNINCLIREFETDYFLYWGSVNTADCQHYIMWIITRTPMGVSAEQVDSLRYLYDVDDDPLTRNFRLAQGKKDRTILHVAPSTSLYSTLHPLPREEFGTTVETPQTTQVYRAEVFYYKDFGTLSRHNIDTWSKGNNKRKHKPRECCNTKMAQ